MAITTPYFFPWDVLSVLTIQSQHLQELAHRWLERRTDCPGMKRWLERASWSCKPRPGVEKLEINGVESMWKTCEQHVKNTWKYNWEKHMKNVRHMLEKLEKLHPQVISAGGIDAERLRKEPQPSRHICGRFAYRQVFLSNFSTVGTPKSHQKPWNVVNSPMLQTTNHESFTSIQHHLNIS